MVQRQDDTEAAIRRRLELYERETAPLIAWYSERDLLVPVEGLGSADEVAARLIAVIDERQGGWEPPHPHADLGLVGRPPAIP